MTPSPRRKQPSFSLAQKDGELDALVQATDHRTLALWAIDCAGRVLHLFEEKFPGDPRPRTALTVCREWTDSGEFSMAVIRTASLDAHAAARDAGKDSPACSAARAAGQAAATAHVRTHAPGAALYARQAVFRTAAAEDTGTAVAAERDWQVRHLRSLREHEKS
ncbi:MULTISPECIES: putative immunity protein [unclassified Methanoregula]|uniref:putative immunity protein n=1 Tax=unclassified Methanoregula TaxID=2649730 RepID=UPI0009D0D07B|nr:MULTISPECIES: hypothetical protein [unclassified Methanoregula]OPX65370.1 MAG: hypothetical protein A4E33_00403 [Methanoregula sp. PtaB.Bin085]OPY32279.1 MAG: hypothetical protein A4E34_02653 [Methanoregula sp. PtaU1.Bin006]